MDLGEEKDKEVKLTAAEVKKYEARFTQLVVRFSNLQLKECIGKGEVVYKYLFHKSGINLRIFCVIYVLKKQFVFACRCIWQGV